MNWNKELDELFDKLYPLNRSITGNGIKKSFEIIKEYIPLEIKSIKTGEQIFDWTIPPEWNCHEGYIITPDGEKICDFKDNNLHVVNFSIPINKKLTYEELIMNLHYVETLPTAIPYVTSYYKRQWGFCITYNQLKKLPKKGQYKVYIKSEHSNGTLDYAELYLGATEHSKKEFLISTYLCHPSMANNELSGPLSLVYLYNQLVKRPRSINYRLIIVPETIGSLSFLHQNKDKLMNIDAGLVLTCLGGPQNLIRYQKTYFGNKKIDSFFEYMSSERPKEIYCSEFDPTDGSDERQFNSPGFRLPIGQIARTVYGQYVEYHTSLDNKEFMGIDTILDSSEKINDLLILYEQSAVIFKRIIPFGEPFLNKYDLYPSYNSPLAKELSNDSLSDKKESLNTSMILLSEFDGQKTLLEIIIKKRLNFYSSIKYAEQLAIKKIIEVCCSE